MPLHTKHSLAHKPMWQLFTTSSTYRKRARLAAALWTLLILFMCLMPAKEIPHVKMPLIDKWVHFIFFGGFSFLWLCARPSRRPARLAVIFGISIGFGMLIECLQYIFVSLGRSADWLDVLADSIGALLGITIFYLFAGIAMKKTHN